MKKLLQILISLLIPFVASAQIVVGDMEFYPNWDENGYYDGTYYLSEYKGTESVVTVPEKVTSDGITYPVTEIGYAFHKNYDITEVILPPSIRKIRAGAFYDCKNLNKINLPEDLLTIDDNVFYNCAFAEINLPPSIQKIGEGAFQNCENLTSIDIPASIKLIEEYTFYNCSSLHSITLNEGIEEIGKCAFFRSGLCSVNLPNSIKIIGEKSFEHTSLDEVYISKNVEYIGEEVFTGIDKLHFNVSPQNIEIDDNAFKDVSINFLILENDITMETCSFPDAYFGNIIIDEEVTDISGIDFSNARNICQIISMPKNAPMCHEFNQRTLDNAILVINKDNSISYYNDSVLGNFFRTTVLEYPLSEYDLIPQKEENVVLNTYEGFRFKDFYKVEPEIDTYVDESWSGCVLYQVSGDAFCIIQPGVYPFEFTLGLNGKKLSFNVTVINPALNIELNKTELTLLKGESIKIVAKIDPTDVTDSTVIWTSSNPNVATVENGLVTAVGGGECDIVATTHNGLEARCHVSVPVSPESISFEAAEVSVLLGDKVTLTPILSPEDVTEKALVWATSDANVALVEDGVVTCVGLGETTITVTTVNNLTAECKVIVNPILAETITLDQTEVEVPVGETFTLTATISPDNTTDKTITWSSSNPDVAVVEDGVVACVSVGDAIITATTSNGLTANCTVKVQMILVESIQIDPSEVMAEQGNKVQLTAMVLPENATNKNIEWTSDNEFVARVDENGLVTIISKNVTTIHAKATDGSGVEGTCEVTGIAGVESLLIDGKQWNVFTPDGVLIRQNVTIEDIRQLAPAIYIISDGTRTLKLVR